MGDLFFSPTSVTIAVGDTVTWHNTGQAPHNATADDGSFKTPDLNNGQSASHTFNSGRDLQLHLHDPPEHEGHDPGAELEQRRRRRRWRRVLVELERLGDLRVIGGRLAGCRRQRATRCR